MSDPVEPTSNMKGSSGSPVGIYCQPSSSEEPIDEHLASRIEVPSDVKSGVDEHPDTASAHPIGHAHSLSQEDQREAPSRTQSRTSHDDQRETARPVAARSSNAEDITVGSGNEQLPAKKNETSNTANSPRPYEHIENSAIWRPTWLQPVVLLAFMCLFLLSAVSLPMLLWYSHKHDGLTETRPELVYLWRFGPTAFITLVCIFWSRVETQALRYMPWIAYFQDKRAGKTTQVYDLDYTSKLSPAVLVLSWRKKHYLVFLVSIASLMLKVQIAFAPGLFNLTPFNASLPIRIRVLDSFKPTISEYYSRQESTAFHAAQVFRNFNMQYPFGLTPKVVYQTFGIGDGTSRGTIHAPLEVKVDGYHFDTHCLKLRNFSISSISLQKSIFSTELRFEDCDKPVQATASLKGTEHPNEIHSFCYHTSLKNKPCNNLPQQNAHWLNYMMRFRLLSDNPSKLVVLDIAAVLCSSTSWISKVKVVDDGLNPVVETLPDESRTLVTEDPFLLMYSVLPETDFLPFTAEMQLEGQSVSNIKNNSSLYTTGVLYDYSMQLASFMVPWAAHYRLRKHSDSEFAGFTTIGIYRLQVNRGACLRISAIFALLACSTLPLVSWLRRTTAINWYRDPTTIIGSMLFLRDNPELSRQDWDTNSQTKARGFNWERCSFTPLVLRTWVRISLVVFVTLVIIGLSSTTLRSESSAGLATIDKALHWDFLWTSFPVLIMLSISLYVSSCGYAHRNLATLSTLARKPANARDLDVSLTDMIGPRLLFYAIRKRSAAVALTQILVFICGLLTTMMSVVFTVQFIPESTMIHLQQRTWFGSREMEYTESSRIRRGLVGNLVLRQGDGIMTFPKNTYDDLVFPNISTADFAAGASRNTSMRLKGTAAKLNSTCTKLVPSDFDLDFDMNQMGRFYPDWVSRVKFWESFNCLNGSQVDLESIGYSVSTRSNVSSFTSILNSPGNMKDINLTCGGLHESDHYSAYRFQTYAWGNISGTSKSFEYLAIWRCNYTWVEIPTEISLIFSGGEYVLDPENPPQPNVSDSRPWRPYFDVPHLNNQFDARPRPMRDDTVYMGNVYPIFRMSSNEADIMPAVFQALIRPYGRFDPEAFRDPSKETEILKDLNHNYAAFAAQLANLENRFSINESSRTGPLPPGSLRDLNAVITDKGRRRLVQNAKVTYAILAILGLVVLFNVAALLLNVSQRAVGETWIFDMEVKGLAPDGFHSIASTVALLRNSNVSGYLPERAWLLSPKELHSQLSELRFRLSWFQSEEHGKRYTVGVLGDDDYKFVGNKKDIEAEE